MADRHLEACSQPNKAILMVTFLKLDGENASTQRSAALLKKNKSPEHLWG